MQVALFRALTVCMRLYFVWRGAAAYAMGYHQAQQALMGADQLASDEQQQQAVQHHALHIQEQDAAQRAAMAQAASEQQQQAQTACDARLYHAQQAQMHAAQQLAMAQQTVTMRQAALEEANRTVVSMQCTATQQQRMTQQATAEAAAAVQAHQAVAACLHQLIPQHHQAAHEAAAPPRVMASLMPIMQQAPTFQPEPEPYEPPPPDIRCAAAHNLTSLAQAPIAMPPAPLFASIGASGASGANPAAADVQEELEAQEADLPNIIDDAGAPAQTPADGFAVGHVVPPPADLYGMPEPIPGTAMHVEATPGTPPAGSLVVSGVPVHAAVEETAPSHVVPAAPP